jgi:hypothetical protein
MNPYIISVDRTNPIGKMVGEYGEDQWKKGFIVGHISGVCLGGVIIWILLTRVV